MIFFDTETFLIRPSVQAPPMVCLQFCNERDEPQIQRPADAYGTLRYLLGHETLVGQNVAFDAAVICAEWPDLIPLVFRAYDEDRVTCTRLREKLILIAQGKSKSNPPLDLGPLSARYGGPALNKADPWRLRYGELINVPIDAWPEEARSYALLDAVATRAVWQGQEQYAELLKDQYRQARAAFALRLMECWGMLPDRVYAEKYIAQVRTELEQDRAIAQAAGLIRADGTRDTKAAMARMVQCALEAAEEIPLTKTGEEKAKELELPAAEIWAREQAYVALDEETVERLGDAELEAYQRASTATTRVARAERVAIAARAGVPIQSSFDPLVDTGRTSCRQGDTKDSGPPSAYGAQIQNTSRARGIKEIFIPRPGFALVSCDYPALELRCWAQECIERVGFSKLADALNADRDPHLELGCTVARTDPASAYEQKRLKTAAYKEFDKTFRYFAKKGNFMFPGGGGAPRFVKALIKDAVQTRDPEIIALARSYTIEQAKSLRYAWMDTWPEARLYFDYMSRLLGERERATIELYGGFVRGGCWYTQLCNSPFQNRGASAAKLALFRVSRECYDATKSSPLYGARIVNFIHDEILAEVRLDRLHEGAHRICEIMGQAGREVCPDLTWKVEPAAGNRWSKETRTLYDSGRLVVDEISC